MTYRLAVFFMVALASVALDGGAALAKGPFGKIHVGNWTGGAYTDNSDSFTHCAAATSFKSGVVVSFGLHKGGNWLVTFGHQQWSFVEGQTYQIEVTLDGQAQIRLFGRASGATFLRALLPKPEEFRKAQLMIAVIKGQTYPFNLNGIGQVFS